MFRIRHYSGVEGRHQNTCGRRIIQKVCLPESAIEESRQCEVNFVTGIESPIDVHRIKDETHHYNTLNMPKDIIFRGRPNLRKQYPQKLWDYWNFRCDLVIDNGLVLKGDRKNIPQSLKKAVLEATHTGHQGETKCLLLVCESVFWPGITNEVRDMVQKCEVCSRHQPAPSNHAAWYAIRAMGEDCNRHIWVRQRETPDDCRLLLQTFHCEEDVRYESTDHLQQVHQSTDRIWNANYHHSRFRHAIYPAKSLESNAEAWTSTLPTVRHTTIKQTVWQKEKQSSSYEGSH